MIETKPMTKRSGISKQRNSTGDVDQPAGIAVQESAHGQRVGAAAGERLHKVAQRQSGIHDVRQQHVFVFDDIVQVLGDAHDARRAGSVCPASDVGTRRFADAPCRRNRRRRPLSLHAQTDHAGGDEYAEGHGQGRGAAGCFWVVRQGSRARSQVSPRAGPELYPPNITRIFAAAS